MAASSVSSSEFLAEQNDPSLDQRVSIAFIVIDTFLMLVFYVSRYFNPKAVGGPMLICNTLCYVFCLGSATTGILMVKIGGIGFHVNAILLNIFQTWLQLSKVLEFTYTPAIMFAKLATLFLYYQVFEVSRYRRIIAGIGVIIVLCCLVSIILAFSICRPFRYFWTQAADVNNGTYGDVMLFYKSYSIPSLVIDVMILVLPWPIVLKLQMHTSEKIGLILTFLAASLGIIIYALRFSVFFTVPLFSDPTWYASGGPMIYTLVEPSIYMIASILPTTRHLYRRICRKVRQAARLQRENDNNSLEIIGSLSQPAEPHNIKNSDKSYQRITGRMDIWQANTDSSKEELTLGDQNRQEWDQSSRHSIVEFTRSAFFCE
ncbi:uncharacterized protein N7483_012518 [Penicillium malachiteum]|uniref:uncharacterized protein n=1 Tax=Penicillium malachiteum TaxID=1324776 RepID=UPI0025489C96|nr:uncharacterized protein N7483_012518 [Penicillium malachiteum]KAJ5715337.1 hypothetical protein N7483_012518 [Penicillium malachiteum]